KLFVAIGKISFSLYMWHQPILVFVRYIFVQHYSHAQAIFIFLFILLISILSFFFIEQPFRKKAIVKTPLLLWSTSVMLVLITGIAVYVYLQAGIIRNVPELDLTHDKAERHVHAKYNDRVYDYNKDFKYDGSIKILVVGNSQARDWVNVLLESGIKEQLQISYVEKVGLCKDFIGRCSMANFIFFSAMDTMGYTKNYQQYHIDSGKVRIIGLKNFGKSNGFFYNKKHDASYCKQRVKINEKILQTNEFLSNEWGNHYINLIGIMIDSNNSVPVFTPDCKFISQDCLHLTKNGSLYFGHLLHQYIKANFMFQ
ncbi:MAG: acyltransferase, partial [Chitinophagaceae bacterium]|nr:acyltransferase [Chitinophagaceae bacterium]